MEIFEYYVRNNGSYSEWKNFNSNYDIQFMAENSGHNLSAWKIGYDNKISSITSSSQCYIFVVNQSKKTMKVVKKEFPFYFPKNSLINLSTTSTQKVISVTRKNTEPLYAILANWVQEKLSQSVYKNLLKSQDSDKIIACAVGYDTKSGALCVCCCNNIAGLHRAQKEVTFLKQMQVGNTNTFEQEINLSNYVNKKYQTGFFGRSGYYEKGTYVNNSKKYIIFDNNWNCIATPQTKSNLQNDYKNQDIDNYTIARLVEGDKSIKYTTVNTESFFKEETTTTEEDTATSRPVSDYILDSDQVEINVNPSSGRTSKSLSYLSNLNNYTLKFVPCKDSRSDIANAQNSFFKNTKVTIKLQNDAATDFANTSKEATSDGYPAYYKGDNNNTIYAVVPREGFLPSTAEIDAEAIKVFSTLNSTEAELDEMSDKIDKWYHLSLGSNAAPAPFGSHTNNNTNITYWRLPGKIYNSSTKALIDISYSNNNLYYYAKKRMPRIICLIVLKETYTKLKEEETNILNSQKLRQSAITFKEYFNLSLEERAKYQFIYDRISLNKNYVYGKETSGEKPFTTDSNGSSEGFFSMDFSSFLEEISPFLKICLGIDYTATLSLKQSRGSINLYDLTLVEAYTRGHDIIQDDFTTVRAKEKDPNKPYLETSRLMDFDDNYFTYKYTGREIDLQSDNATLNNNIPCALIHEKDLLLETDVTLGDTYSYQKYFIQAIKYPELEKDTDSENNKAEKYIETGRYLYKDTFKVKDFLKAIDDTKYIEDDYEIVTSTIDLLQCKFYDPTQAKANNGWADCCYGGTFDKECIYQKCGICPYRFSTEKHPRRIRTLEQSKSNRFNLIQELSKVFKVYPQFYIEYEKNGRIKLDENGKMLKHVFFMTEKGQDKYSGFRYEKNLSSISRTVDSNSLTTKMYVESVDSDLTDSGICSIATAADNIGKNSYVMNFSYYTKKNLLNPEQTQRDIYGLEKGDMAFLPTIGQYNTQYDNYTNLIINLINQEMSTLQASNDVAVTGITTALEERKKIAQRMYQFKMSANNKTSTLTANVTYDYTTSDTYVSYLTKYREQAVILWGLIEQLFFSENYFTYCYFDSDEKIKTLIINLDDYKDKEILNTDYPYEQKIKTYLNTYCKGELFWRLMFEGFEEDNNYVPPFTSWLDYKEKIVDELLYPINGDLGQYRSLYNQVKYWKMEREKILNKINDIADKFYKIYEPYIKEGTWTDSNYLTDDEYYWAAEDVLEDSCKPNLSYSINVIDISPLKEYEDDYTFDLADTTYIEDIDFFGINSKTGLPNREKVIISEISDSLDKPTEDSITVQNYTSSFDDLFEQITASVQSLTYNENTYKRSSNFTAKQYIETDSLQGTLSEGNLTLMDANDSNIMLDDSGTTGSGISNSASKYRLTGEGLYFSTDGGETWDLGVGPQGLNMDYAKFGQLDASKVQIVDGEYIYFLWDKNGINAYRNPSTSTSGLVDFARFNKYGLSLIENGHIRLRAGYEYKSALTGDNPTGNYQQEIDLTNQNVGFYLYNDTGKPIFKTETQSEYGDTTEDYSARLSLKGEMFVTNRNLSSDANNGTVMDAVVGKQLSGGYNLISRPIYEYIKSNYSNLINSGTNGTYYILDNSGNTSESMDITPDYDPSSDLSTIKVTIANFTGLSSQNRIYPYFKKIGSTTLEYNTSRQLYYPNINSIICTLTVNGEITDAITLKATDLIAASRTIKISDISWGISKTNPTSFNNVFKEDNIYYEVYNSTARTKASYSAAATVIIADQNLTADNITYFEEPTESNPKITQSSSASLYPYTSEIDGQQFNYWETYTTSTEVVTTVSNSTATEQVGIFINNKMGVSDEGESSTTLSKANVDTTEDSITEETAFDLFELADGQFYFIGDSITVGFNQNASSNNNKFIGITSMGISNYNSYKNSLADSLSKIRKATYLAFNFGLNDYGYNYTEDTLVTKYSEVIKDIIGNNNTNLKKIFIVSTVGVNISNESEVKAYNKKLKNCTQKIIAAVGSSYSGGFIDIYDATYPNNSTDEIHGDYDSRYKRMRGKETYNSTSNNFFLVSSSTSSTSANATPDEEILKTLAGAQRLFSIILKGNNDGNTTFNNVISVLKNGCLYIGGEVRDYYGRELNVSDMSLVPDEIRIDTPTIIMSNSGTMWCDWSKFKYINPDTGNLVDYSLMTAFNTIETGVNSSSTGTTVTGYYIEDPIEN